MIESPRRAMITGGAGFVGQHLAALLQREPTEAAIISLHRPEDCRIKCWEIDIRNRDGVNSAIEAFGPTEIYHLAALSAVQDCARAPRESFEVNVAGTLNVLEAAGRLKTRVRVLVVSTGRIYANSERPLDEDSPTEIDGPYAASKLMAEYVRAFAGPTVEVVIARSFNHFGPAQSADFVISSFARQIATIEKGLAEPCVRVGNVDVERDFSDVRDIVRAYLLLVRKGLAGDIYNVCSGKAVSIRSLLDCLLAMSTAAIEVRTDPARVRQGELKRIVGDPSKLMSETGWRPEIPLEVTLRDTLEHWREEISASSGAAALPAATRARR